MDVTVVATAAGAITTLAAAAIAALLLLKRLSCFKWWGTDNEGTKEMGGKPTSIFKMVTNVEQEPDQELKKVQGTHKELDEMELGSQELQKKELHKEVIKKEQDSQAS